MDAAPDRPPRAARALIGRQKLPGLPVANTWTILGPDVALADYLGIAPIQAQTAKAKAVRANGSASRLLGANRQTPHIRASVHRSCVILTVAPGRIQSTGPRLGEHNREMLVERRGFDPSELEAAAIVLEHPHAGPAKTAAE